MVDATGGFIKPHSMDIKIGARCWEPQAPADKIKRQKARCPHLDEICFQVLGAKVIRHVALIQCNEKI